VKTVDADKVSLAECVTEAQQERLVIMRDGKPVAMIIGVEGLDEEQLQLGSSSRFWDLIRGRRDEGTISREELEKRAASEGRPRTRRTARLE
jgi:PHD/YefM family antitoxin component YafN of YafNO toxin-antitoxin module